MTEEKYYKYGESLDISINDLQKLKMLAIADNKYNEDHMLLAYVTGRSNRDVDDKEVGKMRENFNRLLELIETHLNKKQEND